MRFRLLEEFVKLSRFVSMSYDRADAHEEYAEAGEGKTHIKTFHYEVCCCDCPLNELDLTWASRKTYVAGNK